VIQCRKGAGIPEDKSVVTIIFGDENRSCFVNNP